MVRVNEVQEQADSAMLAVPREGTPAWESRAAEARVAQETNLTRELNLSGSDVLFGFASTIAITGLLFWALLRLWLFEP